MEVVCHVATRELGARLRGAGDDEALVLPEPASAAPDPKPALDRSIGSLRNQVYAAPHRVGVDATPALRGSVIVMARRAEPVLGNPIPPREHQPDALIGTGTKATASPILTAVFFSQIQPAHRGV